MNKTIDELLVALSAEINNATVVKEYHRYKALIDNDSFLIASENRLKNLQQLMTNHVTNRERHDEYRLEYEALKKKYDEHPYVINYNNYVCEVNELLTAIKTIIE